MPPTNIAWPSSTTTFKIRIKRCQFQDPYKKDVNLGGSHLEVVHLAVVPAEPGDRVRQRPVHVVNAHLCTFRFYVHLLKSPFHLRSVTMLTPSPSWPACVNRLALQDQQGKQGEPGGGHQAAP